MTQVSGPLSVVTESPAVVSAVWVQAPALRTHGAGAILPQRAPATLTGSTVSFSCAPGPAVLIWQVGGMEDQVPILVDDVESQSLAEVVRAARLAEGRTADELAALVRQVLDGAAAAEAAVQATASAAEQAGLDRQAAAVSASAAAASAGAAASSESAAAVSEGVASSAAQAASSASTAAAQAAGDAEASASAAASSASTAGDHATAASGHAQAAFEEADRSSSEADRAEAAAQSAATGVMPDTVGRPHLTPALRGEIDGKAPVSHDHTIAQVSGLQDELDGKASASHTHTKADITDLEIVSTFVAANYIVKRDANGHVVVPATPTATTHAASKGYVDGQVAMKADASHTHPEYATTTAVDGVSGRVTTLENSAPIIVSSLPSSPLPGRIYLVTG